MFYLNLSSVWFSFLNNNVHTVQDFLDEEVLNNPTFTVGHLPIQAWVNNLYDFHTSKVVDIWNQKDQTLKPKREIKLQYNIVIPDITYFQIRSAVLDVYKKCPK